MKDLFMLFEQKAPIYSTLQLFRVACLVYLSSDVRPRVELGDYLKQEGGF
jgi:hypothetical protein